MKTFGYFFALILAALIAVCALAHGAWGAPPARVVRDQAGQRVLVPQLPRRIIALAPSITEMIYTLGCEDRLIGVAQQSNYPAAAKSLPTVGSFVRPDIEKIVALRPDLCIATKDGNPPYAINRLESLGIPVYVTKPEDLNGIMKSLLDIGALLGVEAKAKAVVGGMKAGIEHVKQLVAMTKSRPKVFFELGATPLVSVGKGSFDDQLINYAGGVNITGARVPYPRISREQVVAARPDVIIIASMARGRDPNRLKSQWDRWTCLPAVRLGRVYVVNADLFNRPSVRLVDALELLVRLIHPELFKKPDSRS